MKEIKVECSSQTIHRTFFVHCILSLDSHAAPYGNQLDFTDTTLRSEFVKTNRIRFWKNNFIIEKKNMSRNFIQFGPKPDDLGDLWRWSVGFISPFSSFFTTPVFFVACHMWPEKERWPWPSICSQCWNIFVLRSLESCFEAPMSATLRRRVREYHNMQLTTLNSFPRDWMHRSMRLKAL